MYPNRFERACQILNQQNLDGWLIFSSLGSDIHSSYLLGIDTYAPHFIFLDKNGDHITLSSVMEAPMIKKAIISQNLNITIKTVENFNAIGKILNKFIKNKKIALNYGENIFTPQGTGYANYLRVGEYNEIKNSLLARSLFPQRKSS